VQRGPREVRDQKSALKHLEALVERGWLIELKARQRNRRVWSLPPVMVNDWTG
jgi:hypothetical protein